MKGRESVRWVGGCRWLALFNEAFKGMPIFDLPVCLESW